MKVLLPTEYYPPFVMGGGEVSTKLLAEGLAREDVEVHVLTPNYSSFSNSISNEGGMLIHRFKSLRRFLYRGQEVSREAYRKKRPLFYLALNKYIMFSANEFRKKISHLERKENFDLIHAQNLESILGLNLAEVKCPKIAHIRDFGLFCMNRGKLIQGKLCSGCSMDKIRTCLRTRTFFARLIWNELKWRKTHSELDHYIAVSQFVGGEIKKEGIPIDKISAIHNPVDENQISNLSKEEARKQLKLEYDKIVLYAGALTDAKGAKFVPKLARSLPSVDFVVIGDGPLRPLFERKRANLRNLHYLGQISAGEVKNYYRAADILVVPSIWQDPFPRVVIEGQANGVCVVAFETGGIPEAIDAGKTGFLVPAGDTKKLRNNIKLLLGDEKLIETVGKRSAKKAEKEYRKDIFAKKVLDVYVGLFNR